MGKEKSRKGRKGQKELSMIITLIILLVVAVVTISIFLRIFKEPKFGKKAIELEKIKSECDKKCSNVAGADPKHLLDALWDYCTASFFIKESGIERGVAIGEALGGDSVYCSDGFHCFNLKEQPCYARLGLLDAEKCLEVMCKKAIEVKGDLEAAEALIRDTQNGMDAGTCTLKVGNPMYTKEGKRKQIIETTWYEKYFENPDCTPFISQQPPGGGQQPAGGQQPGGGQPGAPPPPP